MWAHSLGKNAIFAIASVTLLSGCVTSGPWDNYEVVSLAPFEARQVAVDVVNVLATEYAPSRTNFAMSNNGVGHFGHALERTLRAVGYAVSVGSGSQPAHAKSLSYVIDGLGEPGSYRVGVRVQPSYRMDLVYRTDSTGRLEQSGGVMVLNGSGAAQVSNNLALVASNFEIQPPAQSASQMESQPAAPEKALTTEGWKVQVSAGFDTARLESMRTELSGKGFDPEVVSLSDGGLHALHLGPYESEAEAREARQSLATHGFNHSFLVEPTSSAFNPSNSAVQVAQVDEESVVERAEEPDQPSNEDAARARAAERAMEVSLVSQLAAEDVANPAAADTTSPETTNLPGPSAETTTHETRMDETVKIEEGEQDSAPLPTLAVEPSVERWFMPRGEMLSDGVRQWADQAGWELVWKSRVDYRIASALGFSGTIESAVEELILLYSHAEKPLYADISPRQRLIVVSDDPRELGQ